MMRSGLSVRDAKRRLREMYRSQRDRMERHERQMAAEMAARRFFVFASIQQYRRLMIYAPIQSEMDPMPLGRYAAERGWEIYLPRMRGKFELEAVKTDLEADLEPGRYGILEPPGHLPAVDPAELEVVIVPGLAFDVRGHRLGYGAGYYDRFLPQAKNALWIGFTFDELLVPELPAEPHDQRLHAVLTDRRWHWIRTPSKPAEADGSKEELL